MQHVSRPSPARESAAPQLLLHDLDAAKSFLVKRDDEVVAQISIELLRSKIKRACFVRLDAVNDEINVVGIRLDLRLVSCLDRVLDGEVVEPEYVCQDADGLLKPKAFIVLKPGKASGTGLEDLLKEHVKAKAGVWKYPRWVEFVDGLPKTATGKIQRFKLREG